MFVIDVSTALKWFLADEISAEADTVLGRVENGEVAVAPDIFRLEIQNALLSAERNDRISQDDVEAALIELRNLPIRLVLSADRFIPGGELELARGYGLSTYETSYIVCADNLNAELVTADAPLDHAARNLGIKTILV
ncbi:MAG TPA: type II toxin-antitoxin system VapC family toxin [Candidatus Tumulicola sp.]|jgi:predicted nucleic acid-binding protein